MSAVLSLLPSPDVVHKRTCSQCKSTATVEAVDGTPAQLPPGWFFVALFGADGSIIGGKVHEVCCRRCAVQRVDQEAMIHVAVKR